MKTVETISVLDNQFRGKFGDLMPTYTWPNSNRHLPLPDLQVNYVTASTAPNVHIGAVVQNVGNANMPTPCWVLAGITVFQLLNNISIFNATQQAICPALSAGDQALIEFPIIPNVPEHCRAKICVTIDPATPNHPVGLILESNETNNTRCTGVFTSYPEPPGQPHHIKESPDDMLSKELDNLPLELATQRDS